jgi:hypothetical protein
MVTLASLARLRNGLPEQLRGKLRAGLRTIRGVARRYRVVYNVNGAEDSHRRRRALLAYRVMPFVLSEDDPESFSHHSIRRSRQIAAILDELGYVVDATNGQDARLRRPSRRYDLVISDVANTRGFFGKGTTRLFLATTMNHRAHNARLRRRHERLAQRRGSALRPRRIYTEAMPYAARADAIVAVGNETTAGTWREVSAAPIHAFNNHGYRETRFVFEERDTAAARRHFLFFASRDQVQRGLDLLLEVFPRHPDLHLYVCSLFEQETDFCASYRKELYETSNIHAVGWLRVNGPRFYELARRCAYAILPTCGEGQPGSVVQCLHAGLMPLVTREAGIDTEDFGLTFPGDGLEEIEAVIVEAAHRPDTWHRAHSLRARRAAETTYSEAAFQRRWREILTQVLSGPPPGRQ